MKLKVMANWGKVQTCRIDHRCYRRSGLNDVSNYHTRTTLTTQDLLADDVMLIVFKDPSFTIRSPLMKTLDLSVEASARQCNLCVVITLII